jgi:putative transposase
MIGLLLGVSVLPADIQDRGRSVAAGASALSLRRTHLCRRRIQGSKTATTIAATGCWTIEIVRRCPSPSFRGLAEPIDRRGTFAWISRNRQLTRDFERDAKTVSALMRLAMIRLMLKRLTTPSLCPSPLSHGDVPVGLPLQPGRT